MGTLKPCPFCGADDEIYRYCSWFARRVRVTIRCKKCGENSGGWCRVDKAIEVWNRRAEE